LRCRAASTPLFGGGYFLEEYCFAVRFRVAALQHPTEAPPPFFYFFSQNTNAF
jgi:hypothetical protein